MSCGCGTDTVLVCQDDARRELVREREFNGLDYLEVSDDQTQLTVYFLGPAPEGIGIENIEICGGVREVDIKVLDVRLCPQTDRERDNCIVVTVDRPGDFSTYCLCLANLPEDAPFDPRYRCLQFGFKASCPSDLDCRTEIICPEDPGLPTPDTDYLAKDYASFRRLILDRLAVTMPDWTERHVPDIGITLVEVLAYVGDHLSYRQDAVATEAYLDTARQRISVRRHARLVDYHLHEGCNARTWVAIGTSQDEELVVGDLSFLTGFRDAPDTAANLLSWDDFANIPASRYEVFQPLVADPAAKVSLYRAHNEIHVYTWGDRQCCLPVGATSATLIDGTPPREEPQDEPDEGPGETGDLSPDDVPGGDLHETPVDDPQDDEGEVPEDTAPAGTIAVAAAPTIVPAQRALHLVPGDVLIFEEVIGPGTGNPADADPARRQAVRLTSVQPSVDPLTGQPLLEVSWGEEDALTAPYCISTIGPAPDCELLESVSVLRGNVVLADHGRWHGEQDLGCVPMGDDVPVCIAEGRAADLVLRAGPFTHDPIAGPLTFATALDHAAPAVLALAQDPHEATASLRVRSAPDETCLPEGGSAELPYGVAPRDWTTVRDLLGSGRDDAHVAVEVDDRRRATLRFGDDRLGAAPDPYSRVFAKPRIGNGPDGNIGSDKLTIAVYTSRVNGLQLTPRNPLPATGGTSPEPIAEAKLFAPHAFAQELARAVTPEDYAEIAARHPKVQRAAAELRWNGSWYEVRVAIDALGTAAADDDLLAEVFTELSRFRRIGHDLAVRPANLVPMHVEMSICVAPTHLRAHVLAELRQRFSAACLSDGTLGYFHPDALSFGDDIALSRLMAAAQAVEGVESVEVTRLERLFEGPNGELTAGVLKIGPLEIARADTDPNAPENGRVIFVMRGGR